MSASVVETVEPVRARIPADLDLEDQVLAGLNQHQALVLASVAAPLMLGWQAVGEHVAALVYLGVAAVVMGVAFGLVVVHRDGLSLDRWLYAAARHRLRARTVAVHSDFTQPPAAVGAGGLGAPVAVITDEGVVVHPDGLHVVLVASSTISSILTTDQDDAVLAAGMARWLNSLSGPVQIVVRNRPSDLAALAMTLADEAVALPNPALARLALDHAGMLLDLNEMTRPLERTVVIACNGGLASGGEQVRHLLTRHRAGRRGTSSGQGNGLGVENFHHLLSRSAASQALSRARRTVVELQELGAQAVILDGLRVQQLLAGSWTPCLLPSNPEHGARIYDEDDEDDEGQAGDAGRDDGAQDDVGRDERVRPQVPELLLSGEGVAARAWLDADGPAVRRALREDGDGDGGDENSGPADGLDPGAGGVRRVQRIRPVPGRRRSRRAMAAAADLWTPEREQR